MAQVGVVVAGPVVSWKEAASNSQVSSNQVVAWKSLAAVCQEGA